MMPTQDIGLLRHRVTWQSIDPSAPRDRLNQTPNTWITLGTLWAHVEPLGGRELYNARQLKATSTHKITIRGGHSIKASHRFLFQGTGRIFGIDSINRVDERNAYLSFMCTEQSGT